MAELNGTAGSSLGALVMKQSRAVLFLTFAVCAAGVYAALTMPSSVFPQTNFPRVVILVDNGVVPGAEMMAAVTRPIEEAMKDIPGVVSVRSATGRGSAEVNVFFNWSVDMQQSELYVNSRLSQIRGQLPAGATTVVHRLTFSAFPIIGLSLTSRGGRTQAKLWEVARYTIKPRLLQIPGIARVDLVGGRAPEYHVIVQPAKLEAYRIPLVQVADALQKGNLIGSAGLHDEEHQLYLTVVDARVHSIREIENIVVGQTASGPVHVSDVGVVREGEEPQFNIVNAAGRRAVLLNIRSQPDGSTLAIADTLHRELGMLSADLPPDLELAFFYDQSLLVRESVGSVWESILFGLGLSVAILFLFLKSGSSLANTVRITLVAAVVIPVSVLVTLVVMRLLGLSFNLMTLGGIAAAIGLVIDDAIVVVESIYSRIASGLPPAQGIALAIGEIAAPLVGSTLTPVVVFLPLAWLEGLQGVFFRALAITMVVSLLTSLVLAVTLTPTLAGRWLRQISPAASHGEGGEEGGPILRLVIGFYELAARFALRHSWLSMLLSVGVVLAAVLLYPSLKQDFLPEMDEGAFVIDYRMPPGTALSETDRVLRHVETILQELPEVESYSRRTGARLALAVAEPHQGDFLVKLKEGRKRGVEDVKNELREKIEATEPVLKVEMPGILGDLIGDLTWSPKPIEIKIFSTDTALLKQQAARIAALIEPHDRVGVPGVVDVNDGLVYTGSSLIYRVRPEDLRRYGLKPDDVARTLGLALYGETPSSVLEGDRLVPLRLLADPAQLRTAASMDALLVTAETGPGARLISVADRHVETGQLELRREDLRQNVAVSARTSGRDLGSVVRDIQRLLDRELPSPRNGFSIEYGGMYQQQQESFKNLTMVLAMAVGLVFLVLLIEFQTFAAPLAIVWGALLSLFGVALALWLTDTSLNIISFLGAIIGIGIVAKNGILMLDQVDRLEEEGIALSEALVLSGRRRLRPVLMTSLAAALGMLPLAYGVGSGAQMLRPLAISVMGALAISVLLSLVVTPVCYLILRPRDRRPVTLG